MAMAPAPLSPRASTAASAISTVGLAVGYGVALLAIGAATIGLDEVAHWTALIPAMLGGLVLLVALCGRFRLLGDRVVGGAVFLLCVVALAGTLSALPVLQAALSGGDGVGNAAAVIARSATAAASILYLVAMAALMARSWRGGRAGP
jgi:hypothetical protein